MRCSDNRMSHPASNFNIVQSSEGCCHVHWPQTAQGQAPTGRATHETDGELLSSLLGRI